jgi:penicillin-binding protein 1C
MILGGCGTTLEELTGLFSVFANEGKYFPPAYIQTSSNVKPATIISPASAYMISETLSKINRPDFPINWQATDHLPKIAWKTVRPMAVAMHGALAITRIIQLAYGLAISMAREYRN